MHVTEQGISDYVRAFHRELESASVKFLPPENAAMLFHKSLLPARIICYVSTQLGVAIEYISAVETKIETLRGSARVEDLLVRAPKRLSKSESMFAIKGHNIRIIGGNFVGAFPFRLTHSEASVTFEGVKFSAPALKWERCIEYAEVSSNRNAENWSIAAAESRAKDEVLAALFEVKQAKKKNIGLHDYVTSARDKNVLLLGAYDSEGEERLIAISTTLRKLGYEPILIKDIPDFEHYDIPQKVTAIGALSRFVVIDDTSPSGHLVEVEICRSNRWVTILLRAEGKHASYMTVGASLSSNVIREIDYRPANAYDSLKLATQWAENKLKELESNLGNLYPWRTKN